MQLHQIVISMTNEFDEESRVHTPPIRTWRLNLSQVRRLVDESVELGVSTIVFGGGEPFLLGDLLFHAIEYAAFKAPTVRVITNAYWANTAHNAFETVGRLYQSGLRELDLRYADWQQDNKFQQRAKWATMAAQKSGLTVYAEHLMNRTKNGATFVHIKEYPASVSESYLKAANAGGISDRHRSTAFLPYNPVGPDAPHADELLFLQKVTRSHCPYVLNAITAHPDGRLTACTGQACALTDALSIGDWFTASLSDLMTKAQNSSLLQWLRLSGPGALYECIKAEAPQLLSSDTYANLCHLCGDLLTRYETKRFLHERADGAINQVIEEKIRQLTALREQINFGESRESFSFGEISDESTPIGVPAA